MDNKYSGEIAGEPELKILGGGFNLRIDDRLYIFGGAGSFREIAFDTLGYGSASPVSVDAAVWFSAVWTAAPGIF